MLPIYFASEVAAEETGILGLDAGAFVIQLITFILVFSLLKKFAFSRIITLLDKRYAVIEAGVKHGLMMEKEREKLEHETAKIVREARHNADGIVSEAQKEGRELIREAEKNAHKKTEAMINDAEARIKEESEQARRKLEREIVGLVSEATEAVVEEKIDARKDAELIDRAIKKGRNK